MATKPAVKNKTTSLTPKEESKGSQFYVFRQTRYENEDRQLTVRINQTDASLRNWSRTGLGFELPESEKKFNVKDRLEGVQIFCGDIQLYDGALEIKTASATESGTTYYGAAFDSELFLVEGVRAAIAVQDCTEDINNLRKETEQADPKVCQSILGLGCALQEIKRACELEEAHWKKLPFDVRCEAERIFLPNMARKVKETLVHYNVEIGKQLDVDKLEPDSLYHHIFQEQIYPFFEDADLVRRAVEKPRGYAGDYEMMNQIYRKGYEGESLFGRVLHHYITLENSSDSVRFRKPYFIDAYKTLAKKPGSYKVLSLASGPAVEFQQIVEEWQNSHLESLDVTLFDLDREALEHAQTAIYDLALKGKKKPNVTFINSSIKSFLVGNEKIKDTYDLIYSGGLFDYLDNPTSGALVRKFATMLNPGGRLILGNFTKENLTKAFLHLLTQWHLIHKSEEEMLSWADGVEGCRSYIEYDDKKMHAFLNVKKNDAS